jgi:hypothetical protein
MFLHKGSWMVLANRGNQATGAAPPATLLTNDAGTNLLFDDAVANQLTPG